MKIVVVEDEDRIRKGIARLISKISDRYMVSGEAGDGEEGLRIILEIRPDLVIADIKMPNMDGLKMIEKIKESGIGCKFIILSGYAEFEYAKQAVKLGIHEYLLKPITVNELMASIQCVEKEILGEKLSSEINALRLVPPGQILERAIIDNSDRSQDYAVQLENYIGIGGESFFALAVIEFEKTVRGSEKTSIIEELDKFVLTKEYTGLKFISAKIDRENELVLLFVEANKGSSKTAFLSLKKLMNDDWWSDNVIAGYLEVKRLEALAEDYSHLHEVLKRSIVVKKGEVIILEDLQKIEYSRLLYPKDIEERILNLIQVSDFKHLLDNVEMFFHMLEVGNYRADDVREAVLKLAGSVLYSIRHVETQLYDSIRHIEILEWLNTCRRLDRMKNVLVNLVNQIILYSGKKTKCNYSLVVQKALSIISEEYASDLSLNDISSRLHITPEYLSSLFAKEFGKKLIAYITEFRIEKSKELLKTEKYKIYKVAEMVGYPNVKYFCKIFKKITGISTGDYMKIKA